MKCIGQSIQVDPNGFRGMSIRIVKGNSTSPKPTMKTARGDRGPRISFRMIKDWILECKTNHKAPFLAFKTPARRVIEPVIPMFFVDVAAICLVRGSLRWRYIALSYCWGIVDEWRLRLTKSNEDSLMEDRALAKLKWSIPATISDAIHLSRALDEKYLWVDFLGLVQDDPKAMARSIDLMGQIYEQSTLTIVAGSGVDEYSGLPGVKSVSRNSSIPEEGVSISIVEDLDQHLRQSEYSQRAWTFVLRFSFNIQSHRL